MPVHTRRGFLGFGDFAAKTLEADGIGNLLFVEMGMREGFVLDFWGAGMGVFTRGGLGASRVLVRQRRGLHG